MNLKQKKQYQQYQEEYGLTHIQEELLQKLDKNKQLHPEDNIEQILDIFLNNELPQEYYENDKTSNNQPIIEAIKPELIRELIDNNIKN